MLKVESLHVRYGAVHALKGISIVVNKGEIVTLIGNNGAGKSTLIKAISGLVKVEKGTILFSNKKINGLPTNTISNLGIQHVPEGGGIFLTLTVKENLVLASLSKAKRNKKRNLEIVYELFPRLLERESFTGKQLSGGERRMLAIGMSLMRESNLLLLDEPSIGLSPILTETIFETINKIRSEGKSILLVEQNAVQALAISDRGYVIQEGEIILKGNAQDLLNNEDVRRAYIG